MSDPSAASLFITGIGAITPLGIGWKVLAEALDESPSVIEPSPFGYFAEIRDFEPKAYVKPRKALKVMCREIQTSYAASQLAIQDAGLELGVVPSDRIATVFASEMLYAPTEVVDAAKAAIAKGGLNLQNFGELAMKQISPLWMLKYLPNMPACHVGIHLGATGPNNTIVLGDIGGPAALAESVSCIERNVSDVAITTAAGTRVNESGRVYCGDYQPAMDIWDADSAQSDHSAGSIAGLGRGGVVAGEAAASVVVQSMSSCELTGAKPIAEICALARRFYPSAKMHQGGADETSSGLGSTSDERKSDHRPRFKIGSANAIANAIDAVIDQSSLEANQIGHVVCHACGNEAMDQAEDFAIQKSLQHGPERHYPIAWLGHSGAASGMVTIATAATILRTGKVNPSRPGVIALASTPEGSATAVLLRS